jgi:hypothetical protein
LERGGIFTSWRKLVFLSRDSQVRESECVARVERVPCALVPRPPCEGPAVILLVR